MAIASIMLSTQLFGLAAGVYRVHGGKRVGQPLALRRAGIRWVLPRAAQRLDDG